MGRHVAPPVRHVRWTATLGLAVTCAAASVIPAQAESGITRPGSGAMSASRTRAQCRKGIHLTGRIEARMLASPGTNSHRRLFAQVEHLLPALRRLV